MSRERVRTIPALASGETYFAPNGSGGDPSTWTASGPMLPQAEVYERIVDENNRRSRPQSPVLHEYYRLLSVPVTNWSNATSSPYGKGFLNAMPMLDVRAFASLIVHDSLSELARDAEKKVLSKYASVAESWSLLNNLLEIDDTIALFKKLQKYRLNKPGQGRPGYLDWQFGLKPLIGDLTTLYHNVAGLKQRLRELRKNSGAKRRFSEKIPFRPTVDYLYPAGNGGFAKISTVNLRGTARANGAITVSVPPLDSLENNLKVILDALGAHLDAVTVYDAIPFSWLLDWVFPIGDWLESMTDRRWLKPSVVFETGSISYNIRGSLHVKMTPEAGYPDWKEVDIGDVIVRKYERAPFQPTLQGKINGNFPAFKAPELNPGKLAILGGLAKLI